MGLHIFVTKGGDRVAGGQARLREVADVAGVSVATVSRVLNGRAGVSRNTRQQVLAAMDRVGYERPTSARERVGGLVGLILPELENPIFPLFAQIMESAMAHRGITPVLCTQTSGGITEDDYVDLLLDRGVNGIAFVSGLHSDTSLDHRRYQRLIDRGMPVVFVNGHMADVPAPCFSTDERAAGVMAVNHLASMGHERIGLAAGPQRYQPVQRRIEGFLDAYRALGCSEPDARALIIHGPWSVAGGDATADRLLELGCTGIVAASDLMALGAIRAARRRGHEVPADVSVIGYDDSALMGFTDPPLTTLRQPVRAMAHAAVDELIDQIQGHPATHHDFLYPPDLVVRGSTAALRRSTGFASTGLTAVSAAPVGRAGARWTAPGRYREPTAEVPSVPRRRGAAGSATDL